MPVTESLLDIVIPVHDQAPWVDLCIRAVEHHTTTPHHIIVVDSGSRDPRTHHVLNEIKARGHTVITLPENRSFSNAVNVGIEAGSSKYIAVLNDDAIVTEGWDGSFLQDLADKFTGLVGARSNYASGAQGDPNFTGEPPFLVFVCVGLRRDLWQIVGQMDEITFDGFSSEDLDYSWRVKKAGYHLKVSNAFVLHAGSRTLSATIGDAVKRQQNDRKYNIRLIEKWGQEWVAGHSKLRDNILVMSFHAEEWTRVSFMGRFLELKRSDGVSFSYDHITRMPIPQGREGAGNYALDSGFDVLVMMDDDATFPPDLIRRLLAHQKDVVSALAYQRKKPHLICAFEVGDDGLMGRALDDIEHTGLRKVDVSGLHCSMVRTSVFAKLRAAGIKQYFGGFDNKVGEDFAFCLNLKKIGIPVYMDTELITGHLGASVEVNESYKKAWKATQPDPAGSNGQYAAVIVER